MRELTVNKNDAGQRLDKFLSKKFKTMPKSLMYKYIRIKCIKLNSKKCKIDDVLKEGDVLTFYIKDEFFEAQAETFDFMKAPNKLEIIYEDENLLLIDKPQGLLVHPDKEYHFDSLIARVKHYLYEKGEYSPKEENSFSPATVNRIDRNTGGIVIAAKNHEALKALNLLMKERKIKKYYLCLCEGIFKKKEGLVESGLKKNESKNLVTKVKIGEKDSKESLTKYKVIDEKGSYSLVECELLTGRTHQIRVHMSSLKHPLAGDTKYGGKALKAHGNIGQALCSYKLKFTGTEGTCVEYLENKEFEVNNIWFAKNGQISI
ncbi:MAG: RluA family pseudouridine synthase [Clostridia bacterium]|nr:RluA family pseudouridine synthase [Clostridia bacterium]